MKNNKRVVESIPILDIEYFLALSKCNEILMNEINDTDYDNWRSHCSEFSNYLDIMEHYKNCFSHESWNDGEVDLDYLISEWSKATMRSIQVLQRMLEVRKEEECINE